MSLIEEPRPLTQLYERAPNIVTARFAEDRDVSEFALSEVPDAEVADLAASADLRGPHRDLPAPQRVAWAHTAAHIRTELLQRVAALRLVDQEGRLEQEARAAFADMGEDPDRVIAFDVPAWMFWILQSRRV